MPHECGPDTIMHFDDGSWECTCGYGSKDIEENHA